MSFRTFFACLVGVVAPLATAHAQTVLVSRTDGTLLRGALTGVSGSGRDATLHLHLSTGEDRGLPLSAVLGLHGPPPESVGDAVAYLVGGDRIRGELAGGDEVGETFAIRSRTLGTLRVPIDRLQVLVFTDRAPGGRPEDFVLPADSDDAEGLFRPAARGFETMMGAIDRFTDKGVTFEWSVTGKPDLYRFDSLAAVALRDGLPAKTVGDVRLVTRSGDVIHVTLNGMEDGRLVVGAEGGTRLEVALSDVAAMTFDGPDRTALSDLDPVQVDERGTPFEDDIALYPWQRDRTVTGGYLVVGNATWGRGLGTHARWQGTWQVPEGRDVFFARAGIDDSVLQTPVRGDASVQVLVDGEVVFGPTAVRAGQEPIAVGPLPVSAGSKITLESDFGAGWFLGDRVDWLSPVFLTRSK